MSQEEKTEVLEFDLDLKEIPIKVKSKAAGDKLYTLRELDGTARKRWVQLAQDMTKTNKAGVVTGMKDPVGLEVALIAASLFDENNQPVSKDVIASWPSSLQMALVLKARDLSGLNAQAEADAKND